jgi:hypothetical protein
MIENTAEETRSALTRFIAPYPGSTARELNARDGSISRPKG